jgi:hypothetical protein
MGWASVSRETAHWGWYAGDSDRVGAEGVRGVDEPPTSHESHDMNLSSTSFSRGASDEDTVC